MTKVNKTTTKRYQGSQIKRDSYTGRLVEVTTVRGTTKASARSERVVETIPSASGRPRCGGSPIGKRHYRLTLADAIIAHDRAIAIKGSDGIINLHSIESALPRPYSGCYRDLGHKCAALMHAMVSNHGFVDGNKRTALLLVDLLITSGYQLAELPNEPIDDLVVGVASNEMTFDDLVAWFKVRLVKL